MLEQSLQLQQVRESHSEIVERLVKVQEEMIDLLPLTVKGIVKAYSASFLPQLYSLPPEAIEEFIGKVKDMITYIETGEKCPA